MFDTRAVCIPDNTPFTVSLSLSVVPQTDGFPIQEGLPHAACECLCFYCFRFLKSEEGIVRKKPNIKTDSFFLLFLSDRETDLDGAEYSSHKQVGVLVHVQDSEGCGRVGAGRGRHHPCHGSLQRIHWYGAIQPITGSRHRRGREHGYEFICFCVSRKTFRTTEEVGLCFYEVEVLKMNNRNREWNQFVAVEPLSCAEKFIPHSRVCFQSRNSISVLCRGTFIRLTACVIQLGNTFGKSPGL